MSKSVKLRGAYEARDITSLLVRVSRLLGRTREGLSLGRHIDVGGKGLRVRPVDDFGNGPLARGPLAWLRLAEVLIIPIRHRGD